MAKRKADELTTEGKEIKTAAATEVKPLDDTPLPPPTKKAKTEKRFADQIIIKHQPANSKEDEWVNYVTSYYTLKHQCTHGWFEADTIPDPPELIITASEPFGSMSAFLTLAVNAPRKWIVFAQDRKCFTIGKHGVQFADKNHAGILLTALPWAIYFGHTRLIRSIIDDVLNIAVRTTAYENEKLWAESDEKDTCMDALLHLASRIDHGDDYHDLLVILNDSEEIKNKLRNPELSVPFGKVFRDMQICDMSNAPHAVKVWHDCRICNKSVPLWTQSAYVEMALAATGKTDWDDIRAKKIASIKSCKDHSGYSVN